MKHQQKSLKGKVGWCNQKTLGLNKGHYVYIRKVKGDKCDVNTVTSLENEYHSFIPKKLDLVKNGKVYAIPITDADFNRFSGIDKRVIYNVPVSKIKDIEIKKIANKHKPYIDKYMK